MNGADKFTFEVGGNETSGVTGSNKTYAALAADRCYFITNWFYYFQMVQVEQFLEQVLLQVLLDTLSASATSVAEGSAITYTVTANAAVTADTTLI